MPPCGAAKRLDWRKLSAARAAIWRKPTARRIGSPSRRRFRAQPRGRASAATLAPHVPHANDTQFISLRHDLVEHQISIREQAGDELRERGSLQRIERDLRLARIAPGHRGAHALLQRGGSGSGSGGWPGPPMFSRNASRNARGSLMSRWRSCAVRAAISSAAAWPLISRSRRLVDGERAHRLRARRRGDQRAERTVRMADQMRAVAEQRRDIPRVLLEVLPHRRRRALAVAAAVDHLELPALGERLLLRQSWSWTNHSTSTERRHRPAFSALLPAYFACAPSSCSMRSS